MRPLLHRLMEEPDMVVGDNVPYSGQLAGDCMSMHGSSRGVPHVLVEIRNDLIATPETAHEVADHLAGTLSAAVAETLAPLEAAP